MIALARPSVRRTGRALVVAALLLGACAVPRLPTTSSYPSAATPGTVTVRSGDTVYGIARRHGVAQQAVIEANGLVPPYTVWPGQVLRLPSAFDYTVRAGDSLYGIARTHAVDVGELAALNRLRAPYTIYVGQRLMLPRRSATAPAPLQQAAAPGVAAVPVPPRRPIGLGGTPPPTPVRPPAPSQRAAADARQLALPAIPAPQPRGGAGFQWPVAGAVISRFGVKDDGRHNDGINIEASAGTPILAADNGVVAYAGNELRGFGNLVLIRHDGDWVTAYGHAGRLLVRRGEQVRAGQRIATVGRSGSVSTPQLHFEIRQGTDAVDPLEHLPRR